MQQTQSTTTSVALSQIVSTSSDIFDRPLDVPFYSQFTDIESTSWRKVSCGIASLAMIIEYYHPGTVSVQRLLAEGITSGAYVPSVGWSHKGLAQLGGRHGLSGTAYDLSDLSDSSALLRLAMLLKDGPVIASVHYRLEPKNPIPHLIVVNKIKGDSVIYNDPAAKAGSEHVSITEFSSSWKKRLIVLRP